MQDYELRLNPLAYSKTGGGKGKKREMELRNEGGREREAESIMMGKYVQ